MMCIQNLVKFCPSILKILSGNKILTSIKGHNSVTNVQKIVLVNANVYTHFGYILSIALVLKILSGNEMVTELRNSGITELWKDRAIPV